MIKKTVTYTDFDGNVRTEDFYFHLTEAEVTDWELSVDGGLSRRLLQIIKGSNIREAIRIYKELLIKSYGVKSPDGRKFIKNDEVREDFIQTQAFSDMYMKLATDSQAGSEFIRGIMPNLDENLMAKANELIDSSDSVDEILSKLGTDA